MARGNGLRGLQREAPGRKKKKWEICVGMRNKLWCIVLSALYLQNDQLGLQVCGRSLCRRALC